jgi:hypothetical protein
MLLVDNIAAMTPRCHTATSIYIQLHELNLKWPPEPRAQSVNRYANLSTILSAPLAPPTRNAFFATSNKYSYNQISCTAVSFLLSFPPISYMHSSSPTFVLHALPTSSSSTSNIEHRSKIEIGWFLFLFIDPFPLRELHPPDQDISKN